MILCDLCHEPSGDETLVLRYKVSAEYLMSGLPDGVSAADAGHRDYSAHVDLCGPCSAAFRNRVREVAAGVQI